MTVRTETCHRCGGSGADPMRNHYPCIACNGHGVECWRKIPCPPAQLKNVIVAPHTEEI